MMTFRGACIKIVLECPDRYARAYAKTGLGMFNLNDQRCQALYLLNNIKHWRGTTASDVRNPLKTFSAATTP
jgi:hypothetical protein